MSGSPFFLSQEHTNSTCPESHIIQCQKSNDIVSPFPFLSKEMVSIPGGTTKLRAEHTVGQGVVCWQVVVLVVGPGGLLQQVLCRKSIVLNTVVVDKRIFRFQLMMLARKSRWRREALSKVSRYWTAAGLLLDTDQLGKYSAGWSGSTSWYKSVREVLSRLNSAKTRIWTWRSGALGRGRWTIYGGKCWGCSSVD